jgi:hypothetical protein
MDALRLTSPEHEHSAAIDAAAEWLALHPRDRISRPVLPMLRDRFGLSALEAVETIRTANLKHGRA